MILAIVSIGFVIVISYLSWYMFLEVSPNMHRVQCRTPQ